MAAGDYCDATSYRGVVAADGEKGGKRENSDFEDRGVGLQ